LSQQRAQSVKNYLVNQQIMAERISTTGYGETRPISSNDSANGRAQNRRVEIQIVPNTQ
ncbi:OmpA family protein, partial [Psychrobacter sp. CAL346-MNA-CIBAN-0220]